MRFERSPLARFGSQAVLIVLAVPVAAKATAVAGQGWGPLVGFLVVAAALGAPVALDLWAMVAADGHGVRWRNRVVAHRLAWDRVAGFEHGPQGAVLVRTDGKRVLLRALGPRFLGSRAMAGQRVAVLDRLRRG